MHRFLSFTLICLLVFMSGCKKELYTNLSERDVNTMISLLDMKNISSERTPTKEGTFNLLVDGGDFSTATMILKENGYPREPFENMGELFKKEGIISSPLEEKVRYMYALSQNVSETITQIEGVITARVNLVLPKDNAFHEEVMPSSASVFITYHPQFNLERFKSDIKLIVEKSVEGLAYERISVVMIPTSQVQTKINRNEFPWVTVIALLALALGVFLFWNARNASGKKSSNNNELMPMPIGNDDIDNDTFDEESFSSVEMEASSA